MSKTHAVPAPTWSCCASTTRRRSATSSSCSTCCPRTAGYMDGRIQALLSRSCRRWSATPARRRSARPSPPRPGNVYAGLAEQVAVVRRAARARRSSSSRTSTRPVAAATFGEVMCTTYKAFGAVGLITSGAGRDLDQVEALQLPLLHQRHHLRPRLLPHRADQRAGPRRRRHGPPRRPAARRPQRRDHDPATTSPRRSPTPAPSSWPPRRSCWTI